MQKSKNQEEYEAKQKAEAERIDKFVAMYWEMKRKQNEKKGWTELTQEEVIRIKEGKKVRPRVVTGEDKLTSI